MKGMVMQVAPGKYSAELTTLMQSMLQVNPAKRATLITVFQHPKASRCLFSSRLKSMNLPYFALEKWLVAMSAGASKVGKATTEPAGLHAARCTEDYSGVHAGGLTAGIYVLT